MCNKIYCIDHILYNRDSNYLRARATARSLFSLIRVIDGYTLLSRYSRLLLRTKVRI